MRAPFHDLPGRARRRRGRRIAAAGVGLVAAVAVGGLVGATEAPAPARGGAAAAFVPADGAVSWQGSPDGTVAQWEEALVHGIRGALVLPSPLADLVLGGYGDGDDEAPHWVSVGDAAAGRPGGVAREVRYLADDGIRLVASSGGAVESGFSPALLVLPADIRDGASWTSEGAAVLALLDDDGTPSYGSFDYTAESTARVPQDAALAAAAEPGCLETATRLTLADDDPGVDDIVVDGVDLWCPGRGVVASLTDEGVTLPADRPEPAATPAGNPSIAWSNPEAWGVRDLAAVWDDPIWEDPALPVSPATQVTVDGDRMLVDDTSGDVRVLRADGDRLVVERVLHPGGRVLAISAVADLWIVSTGDRRVVAYTRDGERVFSRSLPDLVYAPVLEGPDGLLVAGIDGAVRLLDPATGEDRWRTTASGGGLERATRAGADVVVADQSGGLVALSARDGGERWRRSADEAYAVVIAPGDALVAATGATVQRLDPATGRPVWETDAAASVYDLDVVGSSVLATTAAGLVVVGLADGAVVERTLPDAARTVTDGAWAVVEGGASLRLVDGTGGVVASWPVPAESFGSFRSLVAAPDGAWLVDSVSGIVRLAP